MSPVMQMRVAWSLKSSDGRAFQDSAYFTPYQLARIRSRQGGLREPDRRSDAAAARRGAGLADHGRRRQASLPALWLRRLPRCYRGRALGTWSVLERPVRIAALLRQGRAPRRRRRCLPARVDPATHGEGRDRLRARRGRHAQLRGGPDRRTDRVDNLCSSERCAEGLWAVGRWPLRAVGRGPGITDYAARVEVQNFYARKLRPSGNPGFRTVAPPAARLEDGPANRAGTHGGSGLDSTFSCINCGPGSVRSPDAISGIVHRPDASGTDAAGRS